MDKLVIACVAIFFLLITLGLIIYISYSRKKTYNELREKYKKELEEDLQEASQKLVKAQEELACSTEEAAKAFNYLQSILKDIDEKKEFNETLCKVREEELNNLIETKKKAEFEKVDKEVDEWAESAQEAATFYAEQVQKAIQKDIENGQKELNNLTSTIDDYKARRDVINQEILRARAIEEQQDFYRVQLDDKSKEDIQVLNDIRQRLNKTDLLNKLIYENYIARPTKEMVKRVLEGKNPSGIYKVTNIKTNEIYIGKSTKISDRFQNHIKSACGLEGVAESQFQRALKKYGVDNFTWELLEEVPKENLSEREKYYIIFYGTKDYGYNQREG